MSATDVQDDPYAHVAKGPLKLKSDQTVSKRLEFHLFLGLNILFSIKIFFNMTSSVIKL